MHQRSSVGDGRFIPTSSDVTNQWPGLVSRRCCMSSSPVLQKTRNVGGRRCTKNLSMLKRSPVGVVWKLGKGVPAQMSF
ncbi:hypothetical protein TNCV_3512331 [Trichonephila clavipes]|nr:hypothetical protein TNCV_3512331 [Trichonephila clavipes]